MQEIRLRSVSATIAKKVQRIQTDYGEKTSTGAVEKLIDDYPQQKQYAESLEKKVEELNRQLSKYRAKDQRMKELIQDNIKNHESQLRDQRSLLKHFGQIGTKQKRSAR